MSDPAKLVTPQFVLRYRVHTLLWLTTAAAVLAAIAGPYLRRQKPAAQAALLIYWGLLIAIAAGFLWLRLRVVFSLAQKEFGETKFLVTQVRGRRRNPWLWWLVLGLNVLGIAVFVGMGSVKVVDGFSLARQAYGLQLIVLLPWLFFPGSMTATLVVNFVKRPLRLCENGIAGGRIPWAYIRSAEWIAGRPDILRLYRIDGDIFLEVAAQQRAAVEAFLRGKTQFRDAAYVRLPSLT